MMRRLALPTAATSLAVFIAACGELPPAKTLPSPNTSHENVTRRFVESQSDAVTVIPVSKNAFRPIAINAGIRPDLAATPLDLKFPNRATLGDLVAVLGSMQIPIVVNNDAGIQQAMTSVLPFSSYKGRLGDLLDILRRASSVTSTQRGDFIYMGTLARYSVDLPQNNAIMDTIAGEIQALGGSEIVKSVTGGQLIYQAEPDAHDSLINPYLDRISDNLAMVTMQVAVVSLAVNDSTSQGFDWNAFKIRLDGRVPGSPGDEDTSIGSLAELPGLGSIIDASASAVSIGRTGTGELFGRAATYTIGAALNFLSTFGETEITQNVELKTIAGQTVSLRSGQEVPYVSGISNTTTGDATTAAAETETIQTGLTVGLSPFYDSGTGLVTLELDLEQRQILQFVELSAGDGVGTITQPLTQDQKLTDLIRVPVGQTIVVGGLQNENYSTTGSEPSFLRKALPEEAQFGNRSRNVSRTAYFIVVRPTVTVFERR